MDFSKNLIRTWILKYCQPQRVTSGLLSLQKENVTANSLLQTSLIENGATCSVEEQEGKSR